VRKGYVDGDRELELTYGVEKKAEVLFFFESILDISLELVEMDDFGVDDVKDLAELHGI